VPAQLTVLAQVSPSPTIAGVLAIGISLASAGVTILLLASTRRGQARRGMPGAVLAAAGAVTLAVVAGGSGLETLDGAGVVPLVAAGTTLTASIAPASSIRWLAWGGGLRRQVRPPGTAATVTAGVIYAAFAGGNAALAGASTGLAAGLAAGGVAMLAVSSATGRAISSRATRLAALVLSLIAYATLVVPTTTTDAVVLGAPVTVAAVAAVLLWRMPPDVTQPPGGAGVAVPAEFGARAGLTVQPEAMDGDDATQLPGTGHLGLAESPRTEPGEP
jgi:hypothetical protein